ncbi:MAG: alpha/beta hydrolase [Alphaproteobacteria bacterium]|nr:alpha/beta hydrolase [Alphaproteobacteria bacterium]
MITDRLTLSTMILSSTLAGWSFYNLYRARTVQKFRRLGVEAYQATLDNGQLFYWAGGKGDAKPLLLIHGFGGDAMFGWSEQMRLARHRFLIAPDLLWFGGSHSHAGDFTHRYQARTLEQLLDHLAVERCDVVGISYGGFVAGELANACPDRVDKLVIVDSPGHVYTLDDYHAMLDRLGLDSIAEMIVPDDPSGVRRLLQLAYHRPPPVPSFVARDIYAHMFVRWKVEKVRLLDQLLAMADQIDPRDYHITAPTKILWGEHDELFPVPVAHRLADALDGPVDVHVIPSTNHAPNMERWAHFNDQVMGFIGV